MNLSESSIAHLEKKAFLRGLEEASRLAWDVADDLECEERSGAKSVQFKIDDAIEKLSIELGEQEEA